jgi:hypothetical protein
MLTVRDKQIINHIVDFKAASSHQIERLFFRGYSRSDIIARRRLASIVKLSEIKRIQDRYSKRYLYYHGSKAQLYHKLYVAEFYTKLIEQGVEIVEFQREMYVGNLRADAFTIFKYNGFKFHVCVEVQLCHEPLDTGKYEELARNKQYPWPTFPRIVVISDREYKINSPIQFIQIGTDFSGWERVFLV